jgi:citronellol/citronellal dehydrogenase
MPDHQLDFTLLPGELRHLAPLIARYGQSDDVERAATLASASDQELRALSDGPRLHWDAINAFLDENVAGDPGPLQDVALALDSFSQAALEAKLNITGALKHLRRLQAALKPKVSDIFAGEARTSLAGAQSSWNAHSRFRDEASVVGAVTRAVETFGGIDILVNNASAISLTGTLQTPMKRFDLMFGVNVRGTFVCSQACLPELIKSAQAGRSPHILTLSPPLNMKASWFAPHVAYTMAKYGMSMCVLGMAREFRSAGVAINALWPRTVIATAALQMIPGAEVERCRKPDIMADAAHAVLLRDAGDPANSGNFYIDDEVLAAAGVTDLSAYAVQPGASLRADIFLDS